ncbi:Spherulation-specific family 4 [Penicillium hispanicum]|uniref:Spherulation-specific family 4 n=1 Tax=Penicillium hispanicum TaxID=1080232 RepID=UPI002541F868|nr:Spherulation-specific family 4 [Penicillium hispanicum]KAJ5595005.1 Spherulation-specific family 4 [Penicillium hispanicum]
MHAISWIMGTALAMASAVSSTSVLLPLYVYPETPDIWSAVYNSVASYPSVQFQIIINPSSGPGGNAASLGSNLRDGIAKLNKYENVELIGYVRTSYATRNESEVDSDVATYAQWSSYRQQNLNISGIFFDEAPSDNDQTLIRYMQRVSKYAKGHHLNTTVFNPGTKVKSTAYYNTASLIVEVENTYSEWTEKSPSELFSAKTSYSKDAIILYDAPLSEVNYKSVIQEASQMGLGAAFLTNDADYKTLDSVETVAAAFAQV